MVLLGFCLSHLSKEEIGQLITSYYGGDNVKKLIKEYNLKTYPGNIYKLFPPKRIEGRSCSYCGAALVIDRVSKSRQGVPRYEAELYCPDCMHFPYSAKCSCVNCIEQERIIMQTKINTIELVYGEPCQPITLESLSFREKVYWGSLCKLALSEDMKYILPLSKQKIKLAPGVIQREDILLSLIRKKIIVVSPNSNISAFVSDDNFPHTYDKYLVDYFVNVKIDGEQEDILTKILDPQYYCKENGDEALKLWREIAIEECLEYLLYKFETVGFTFSPGKKTHAVINIMLNNFSVSQIYGIISRGVDAASRLYLASDISKRQAANNVISSCERLSDWAIINGWDMKKCPRINKLPQSALSDFFFNRVIKIGNLGFDLPPTAL